MCVTIRIFAGINEDDIGGGEHTKYNTGRDGIYDVK